MMMGSTITRVTDKKHHVTDVLAGGLLGVLFAGAAFALLAEQRCDYNDEGNADEDDSDQGDADKGEDDESDAGDVNVDGKHNYCYISQRKKDNGQRPRSAPSQSAVRLSQVSP